MVGKRPISVMVYSGILILNAIVNLCAVLIVLAVQDDAAAQDSMEEVHRITTADYLVSFLDVGVFLVCGAGLFLRQGWSRFLLIGWVVLTLLYALVNQELRVYHTARALMFIGIMAVFMFDAKVSAWFSGEDVSSPVV